LRFCPRCETRLRPYPGEEEVVACSKCGFKTKKTEEAGKREDLSKKASQDVSLKVMDGDTVEALPTTSIECPECKNGTAFWWMLQTRSADEATTQFYRCTKCNHTWRNYA
jgi:DNA-directed RNA polymerase subunit M